MVKIIQKDNSVLRQIAKNVPISEISSKKFRDIIRNMRNALASEHDGVAIAAPQIGESYRIFIISGKIFDMQKHIYDERDVKPKSSDLVCINPILSKLSREKSEAEEGCLSVRYLYGKTNRSLKATVTAYDEFGKKFTRGASGLLAQAFQHENDHLDGVLFTDKAKEIVEIPPEELNRKK